MKAIIVFNSAKENTYFVQNLHKIIYRLNKLDYEVVVRASMKPKDLQHYIETLDSVDVLVVSGGDGTLHEAVNGICINEKIDPKILYFMSGTVNDVAHSLKLTRDIDQMLNLLEKDEYKVVDCGKINDSYFIYVAAFGAFTKSSYNTPENQKNHLKQAAYVFNGISEIGELKNSYALEIIVDDKETISGNFKLGLISNSESIAGLRNLFKGDKMDDGYFNLYLTNFSGQIINQSLKIMKNGITIDNNKGDTVYRRFKKIKIKAKDDLIWTLDGEKGYNGSIEIEVIESKIKIYAPEEQIDVEDIY